ncbi:MAG: sulfatase-like hydrolase/transferase, partial [Clostridia bacterium]|nr:sulfatase-like hydrolase/transferase [Clostridia bacterium]
PGYVNAVSRVDVLISRLYAAYEAAGMLEDTLFILCADHGHRLPGGHKNHGKNTSLEVNVTFAISGKTVKSGTPGKFINTDLAAVVSYALGVKASDNWQGRVPYNMFTTLG